MNTPGREDAKEGGQVCISGKIHNDTSRLHNEHDLYWQTCEMKGVSDGETCEKRTCYRVQLCHR